MLLVISLQRISAKHVLHLQVDVGFSGSVDQGARHPTQTPMNLYIRPKITYSDLPEFGSTRKKPGSRHVITHVRGWSTRHKPRI